MFTLAPALQLSCHRCQPISNLLAFARSGNNTLESHSEQEPIFPWETHPHWQEPQNISHTPPGWEEERGGLCLLPLAAFALFIFGEGLWSPRDGVGQRGRGQGPWSYFPCTQAAFSAPEQHSIHS